MERKNGNISKAKKLYKKACKGGVAEGCFVLGNMAKIRGKFQKAMGYYEKACDGQHSDGCAEMAYMDYLVSFAGYKKRGKKMLRGFCVSGNKRACKIIEEINRSE